MLFRGQVGVEVLAIISLALVLFVPFIFGVYSEYALFSERLSVFQASEAVATLATISDAVVSSGPGSNVSTQIIVPSGVKRVSLQGREIVFELETGAGKTDIVRMVKGEVEGDEEALKAAGTRRVEVVSVMENFDDVARVRINVK
ncbi:hypothetical protein HY992_03345 [Candidatus Micrarchaeota archaeon]|nr:hypothetical protein [Candidatus Micrarchaeota archaeon]